MPKFIIDINNTNNIKDLLQIAYNHADGQIIQAQNEINKLASATQLQNEVMESKAKYSKAINDYLNIIDKSISRKVEIAKLMNDILNSTKNNAPGLVDSNNGVKQSFDLSKIKQMVKDMHEESEKTKTIELNKK